MSSPVLVEMINGVMTDLPVASPVQEVKLTVRKIKARRPKVATTPVVETPAVVEPVVVAPPVVVEPEEEMVVIPSNSPYLMLEDAPRDETITLKKSEWEALIARVALLEKKPTIAPKATKATKAEKPTKEKKPAATRIPTKGVVLKEILRDGEIVYADELINDGTRKGQHRTLSATFSYTHNGFHINSIPEFDYDENSNEFKTPYANSPTTLCSRFRFLMNQHGESIKDSSTCCGFAKCYVKRNGENIKLNKLW